MARTNQEAIENFMSIAGVSEAISVQNIEDLILPHQDVRRDNVFGYGSLDRNSRPAAPEFENMQDYSNDIEEKIIRPAIEASKREAERNNANQQYGRQNEQDFNGPVPQQSQSYLEDHELAHATSLHSYGWGAIFSADHDEAVMLEAAMSGGVPEGSRYFGYAPHHVMQPEDYPRPTPHPPSPALAAQQSIREQQDGEYFASLQADREIELKAMEEAESALEEERQRLEEFHRKLQEEQVLILELGRHVKYIAWSLFDFMDIGRVVKPGTYRLVRSYPRRASSDGESALTLNELDLTSNQEATIHLGLCCSDKIDMKLFIYNNP